MTAVFVCHDLGNNAAGRAWALATLLVPAVDVEIVGVSRRGVVWAPLQNMDLPVRLMTREALNSRLRADDVDVIVAVKPRPTSLGAAMSARRDTGVAVVSDVDDWELAFYLDDPTWWVRQCLEFQDPNNFWQTWRVERLVRRADAVTVSTGFLQQRFGGVVIEHARDDAPPVERGAATDALRRRWGLGDRRVVLFAGSARPHKGLPDVVSGLDEIDMTTTALLVVGSDPSLPERPWIVPTGDQPMSDLPKILALADVVVIPQRRTRVTQAQLPAKLFDAMKAGRPVVTTNVSDIPKVVGSGGVCVEPGDSSALAREVVALLDDPHRAESVGSAGRARFIDLYSTPSVAERFRAVIGSITGTPLAGRVDDPMENGHR